MRAFGVASSPSIPDEGRFSQNRPSDNINLEVEDLELRPDFAHLHINLIVVEEQGGINSWREREYDWIPPFSRQYIGGMNDELLIMLVAKFVGSRSV